MRDNTWKYCKSNPPDQYIRCEIKDHKGVRYVGYRCGRKYYETIGNYIIEDPYVWRYVPRTSHLWETIEYKIRNFFCGGENGVYADVDKDWR